MSRRVTSQWILSAVGMVVVSGCSHAPVLQEKDPSVLLNQVCDVGGQVRGIKGSIWMKAASKDASGQFPAQVQVTAPATLRMEVTNLLGGTEAIIRVDNKQYQVDVPGHAEKTERGTHNWAGIPLEWATELFLGKIPCPEPLIRKEAVVSMPRENELLVKTGASLSREPQKFLFHLRRIEGRAWADTLRWEREGMSPVVVDFKFSEPEERTRTPLKWEAKSLQGEVKVRWKERDLR